MAFFIVLIINAQDAEGQDEKSDIEWGTIPTVVSHGNESLETCAATACIAVKADELARVAEVQRLAELQAILDAENAKTPQLESDWAAAQTSTGASGNCAAYGFLGQIAQMESGCSDVPNSGGSGATGYLQFMPGTFAGVCGTCCDIHSLDCQMQAGQRMIEAGRQCEWSVLHC